MRNPGLKFAIAFAVLIVAATLFRVSLGGFFGPDTGWPASAAGIAGAIGLCVATAFVVTSSLAALGAARLRDPANVIARWEVPPATWERFCEIRLADAGVRLPGLTGLLFEPRRKPVGDAVPIVCGKRGVMIDGCYFSVAPGRGAGMEQAGLVHTFPPCVALVIAARTGAPRALRTVRRMLLLPIPDGAERESNKAIVHYAAEVAGVRDLGEIARANPVLARVLFWSVLAVAVLAGAIGFRLEAAGYPGTLPGVLGITGIAVALGTLLLGLAFSRSR